MLLENGDFSHVREEESKDTQLTTRAAVFLRVRTVENNDGASVKTV